LWPLQFQPNPIRSKPNVQQDTRRSAFWQNRGRISDPLPLLSTTFRVGGQYANNLILTLGFGLITFAVGPARTSFQCNGARAGSRRRCQSAAALRQHRGHPTLEDTGSKGTPGVVERNPVSVPVAERRGPSRGCMGFMLLVLFAEFQTDANS